MELNSKAALVLLSGGQDSATCLAWALARYDHVETVGYDYGQRHAVELEARQNVRGWFAGGEHKSRLGADHRLSLPAFAEIGETAMTAEIEIATGRRGLPTTFVPGRNLVFLSFAGALAVRRGIATLVGGMCEADAVGYPDCRSDTLETFACAMALGIDPDLTLETPLMHRSKAGTWALAHELGGDELVEMIRLTSHTCYKGDRSQLHDWGYGCGECPACLERAKGYTEWRGAQ